MMAPIIGITTYGRNEKRFDTTYYDEFYTIPADYVDAVRRAGGVPILLPPGEPQWEAWLKIVDGIVVSGGSDIQPSYYGGNSDHPNLTPHDPPRDETELSLTKQLLDEMQTPSLFICRGMQVLNVASGGSLHEHIPDFQAEDIHRGTDGGWAVQPVKVNPASLLHRVMGTEAVATYSGHHQAIKELGQGLTVSSTASDGVIEALENSEHPWLLAVQWHPEKSAAKDETQQRLFNELVKAANGTIA
jgi:putative glutamine amidotransferase